MSGITCGIVRGIVCGRHVDTHHRVWQGTPMLRMFDRSRRALNVYVDAREGLGDTFEMALFTSYWIINKAGLPLSFRQSLPTSRARAAASTGAVAGGQAAAAAEEEEEEAAEEAEVEGAGDEGEGAGDEEDRGAVAATHGFRNGYVPAEVTSGPNMVTYHLT